MSATKLDIIVVGRADLEVTTTKNVAASATVIYPGEPVAVNALGDVVVIKGDNNFSFFILLIFLYFSFP
jgi:hypothetical protein